MGEANVRGLPAFRGMCCQLPTCEEFLIHCLVVLVVLGGGGRGGFSSSSPVMPLTRVLFSQGSLISRQPDSSV